MGSETSQFSHQTTVNFFKRKSIKVFEKFSKIRAKSKNLQRIRLIL